MKFPTLSNIQSSKFHLNTTQVGNPTHRNLNLHTNRVEYLLILKNLDDIKRKGKEELSWLKSIQEWATKVNSNTPTMSFMRNTPPKQLPKCNVCPKTPFDVQHKFYCSSHCSLVAKNWTCNLKLHSFPGYWKLTDLGILNRRAFRNFERKKIKWGELGYISLMKNEVGCIEPIGEEYFFFSISSSIELPSITLSFLNFFENWTYECVCVCVFSSAQVGKGKMVILGSWIKTNVCG